MADESGLAKLTALGARSVPVVARGGKYVYAQVLKDVAEFLDLELDSTPQLSAPDLIDRYQAILTLAIEQTRQMPDQALNNQLPNRPRSWRVLLHHVFQIAVSWLDADQKGETLTYENMVAPPPANMTSSQAIADFGAQVVQRFEQWAEAAKSTTAENTTGDFAAQMPTYFGSTSRHEMLERTVTHSTQHLRQIQSLLQSLDIEPPTLVTNNHLAGLPVTQAIWDE